MTSFSRKVTTVSGATVVQVMARTGRYIRVLEHPSSAPAEAEFASFDESGA